MKGPQPRDAIKSLLSYRPSFGKVEMGHFIRLSANEGALGTSPKVMAHLKAYHGAPSRYPEVQDQRLCEAIAALYELQPDRILSANGSDELLSLIAMAYLEAGDEAVHTEYAFLVIPQVIKISGAIPIVAADKNFTCDVDAILAAVTARTKVVFLVNPNNPTGSFVEKSEIDKLAKGLESHPHVTILSDEIYSRQIFDDKEMPTFFNYPALRERLIVLEGWSKAYSMTGWRLGWSFWPEHLVEHVNKLLINSVSCVNAAAQFAGIAALDGPDDSIHEMMEKFTARRNLIHKGLNDLPGVECSLPGGAFYAFPNVKETGMSGKEFCKKAMHEAGVAIVPGTAFGQTCQDYVRFSFAASRDNISQALENIKKMLT